MWRGVQSLGRLKVRSYVARRPVIGTSEGTFLCSAVSSHWDV